MIEPFRWDQIQRTPQGKILLLYRHERVFDGGFIRPDMDVLDVGGWGVLAQAVIEAGANCTILDLFTADQAYPERVRGLPHVVGDVRDRDCFPGGSFNTVTCFETLEHVGDIPSALANMRFWLKRRGWLVGTVPMPGHIHAGDPACEILSEQEIGKALRVAKLQSVETGLIGSLDADDEPICIWFQGQRP